MTLAGHSTIATLWDARTGAKRRDLQSTRVGMWLEDLRFSPDGRILVTSELSAPVRLWNTATGQELREIVEPEISGLAMARDGSRAAGGTGRLHGLDFALVDEMLELESKVGAAREALRTSAQDGAALVVVGRWLAMNGRHEWAVELLERARAAGAEVPDLVVGRAWWARGRLDEAAPAFERALRKGEAPEAYLRLCLTAVRRGGGPSEAHAAALAWSPEALWERVKARIEARDGPGVTKELRRGVTLLATLLRADPDNREALAALVSVSRRAASMFAENKQVPVAAAMAEVALKAVEEVARERPADFAVLDAVGGLRMQLGGLRERQEQWREAFEAYRGAEEAYLPRVAAAAQDLEAAAKLASAYEATSSLIRPEQAVERLMKAKVEREKVLAVRSNDLTARSALGGVHRRLVQVRMQQKETEAAKTHARDWRAVAEEGRKLAPKDPDARWGAAQAAMFQSWISVDLQDWPAAHLSYGDALPLLEGLEADGVLKNYGQGPAMLGEARENVVKTAAMHIQSLIQAGKMDEAAAAAARYAETWPNEPDMVSARGMVAAARRDYDLAVRVYDEALKKWPDNTGLLYNAACAASLRSATRKDAERAADVARAVELLGRAVKAGYANADHVEKDGDMDPIRGEEGYKAAIAEMRKRK
jgi:tetratricopeptide (TPR) repeat protein